MELKQLLIALIAIWVSARLLGQLFTSLGRPAMLGELIDHLQPQRGLAASLFAEDDRRRGMVGAAVDFIPRRVVRAFRAMLLEQRVGLGVFLAERILRQPVMFEKLLNFHPCGISKAEGLGPSVMSNTCSASVFALVEQVLYIFRPTNPQSKVLNK
jgi:hypothetical protein